MSVFISYSRESTFYVKDVKAFASSLFNNDIDVILDEWDLDYGDSIPQFMEQSIDISDTILLMCTPDFKQKFDHRIHGVGYEGDIISANKLIKTYCIII